MDDWTMYQITGDAVYIDRFRRHRAVRAGLMGGSLGAVGIMCTSMMTAQFSSGGKEDAWPPRWLPRRCAAFALLGGILAAASSYRSTQGLVGQFVIAQPDRGTASLETGATPPPAYSGATSKTI
eukprot:TRINITY_DN12375_c0_g1_i2.p1 TRINITY_DN12375_c0_g1~~TRINITY_DN12375_c0_g1_i2.p1  ORF type:complete len:124 (-),score=8.47 TRINITY_DN12375_c0_g1_i2:19-390(-)